MTEFERELTPLVPQHYTVDELRAAVAVVYNRLSFERFCHTVLGQSPRLNDVWQTAQWNRYNDFVMLFLRMPPEQLENIFSEGSH